MGPEDTPCAGPAAPPLWTTAPPRDVAVAILADAYGPTPDAGEEREPTFGLTRFQADAVARAERILARRGGVLVADDVGLGKTFVALALIERALRRGARVAVVTPAGLRRDWRAPLRRLRVVLGVRDGFGLDRVHEGAGGGVSPTPGPAGRAHPRPFLAWISASRLSRGGFPAERLDELDLVAVDEAHGFRNPGTRRYRALSRLCRGARVVLLTATPVNNSLWDLYFQLRLFAGDGDFRDIGIPDLASAFRAAATQPEGVPAEPVRRLLADVAIRRTRAMVRAFADDAPPSGPPRLRLPERAPPVAVRYDLDAVFPGFYDGAIGTIAALELAPLALRSGRNPGVAGGDAATALSRLGLLKRLESSVPALRSSLARYARYGAAFLAALERGRLLTPGDFRGTPGGGIDGEALQLVVPELLLGEVPRGIDRDALSASVRRDIRRIGQLLDRLATLDAADDPKLRRLAALLDGELRGHKVVVFSEFRTTARALWRALRRGRAVGLVDGAGAYLGAAACDRRAVIERFAPRANGRSPPPPAERIDLLVATDVLAEGLNLHDADVVVSYDLPWNPVRLVQRIGRVDRLGTEAAVVRSFHFLPDGGLERLLGVVRRLRRKLAAIRGAVGSDAAVLDGFEAEVDAGAAGGGERDGGTGPAHGRAPAEWTSSSSLDERLRAACAEVVARRGATHSTAPRAADGHRRSAPPAGTLAAPGSRARVLLAYRSGAATPWLVYDPARRTVAEDRDTVAAWLLRALADSSGTRSVDARLVARALAAAGPVLEALQHGLRAPARLARRAPGARAARRLLDALAREPGGPGATLCRRADRVLATLRAPLPAGVEAALVGALARPTGGAAGLLDALESALDAVSTPDAAARHDAPPASITTGRFRLVGALVLSPVAGPVEDPAAAPGASPVAGPREAPATG